MFIDPILDTWSYEDLDILTNYDVQFAAIAQANAPGGKTIKQGFSSGSGLRSIAEGSSNAANDAVNNQEVAGHQAAYVAKNTLAQSAAAVSDINLVTFLFSNFVTSTFVVIIN